MDDTKKTWNYAVERVRQTLRSDGLQSASDFAQLWQRNAGFDAVKLLAEAKGVPIN